VADIGYSFDYIDMMQIREFFPHVSLLGVVVMTPSLTVTHFMEQPVLMILLSEKENL
jgi:hypothetical protein